MKTTIEKPKFAAAILEKDTKRFRILTEWNTSLKEIEKYASENFKKYVILEQY